MNVFSQESIKKTPDANRKVKRGAKAVGKIAPRGKNRSRAH